MYHFDFGVHVKDQIQWSLETFGPGPRPTATIAHIRKELEEIAAKPDDLEEWIDVVILAIDGAWRTGATADHIAEALAAKLVKNKRRQWPDWRTARPGEAIEHVR